MTSSASPSLYSDNDIGSLGDSTIESMELVRGRKHENCTCSPCHQRSEYTNKYSVTGEQKTDRSSPLTYQAHTLQNSPPINSTTRTTTHHITTTKQMCVHRSAFANNLTEAPRGSYNFDEIDMIESLKANRLDTVDRFRHGNNFTNMYSEPIGRSEAIKKRTGHKMTEKLRNLGKAACKLFRTALLEKSHGCAQSKRCEIQIDGYKDDLNGLLIFIGCHQPGGQSITLHLPPPTETNHLVLPGSILPDTYDGGFSLHVYCLSGQDGKDLAFSKVLASGVCTVNTDHSQLLIGRVELQSHRPVRSLLYNTKHQQGKAVKILYTSADQNRCTFQMAPNPIAQSYTEVYALQTADPFCEYVAFSMSSCDHPAVLEASLTPGCYYAIGGYRMSTGPIDHTWINHSTATQMFFKCYPNKATVKANALKAAENVKESSQAPTVMHTLSIMKKAGFDLSALLNMLHFCLEDSPLPEQTKHILDGQSNEALLINTWACRDMQQTKKNDNNVANDASSAMLCPPIMDTQMFSIPCMAIFNPRSRLYFADNRKCYGKAYVTLVLCPQQSQCHNVCKETLYELDPYNNPFFYREKRYNPEPHVSVYYTNAVQVEVIYTNSASVLQQVFTCSDTVYYSQVRVANQ